MRYPVKWFSSEMGGAPAANGLAGSLTGILDACLIYGFGTVTVTSISVASGAATVTVDAGHGFLDHQIVTIAGATPAGLNGEHRVTIIDANQFEFATTESDGTAGGAITAKTSPVGGWSIDFTDTNRRVYSRDSVSATPLQIRVDSTGDTKHSGILISEGFTDIDTPDDTYLDSEWWMTSSDGSSELRDWHLIADDLMFFLMNNLRSSGLHVPGYYFGDINSFIPGDQYHCAYNHFPASLAITSSGDTAIFNMIQESATDRQLLAKRYDQSTRNQKCGGSTVEYGSLSYYGQSSTVSGIVPVVGGPLFVSGILCAEFTTGTWRGVWPGLVEVVNGHSEIATGVYRDNSGIHLVSRSSNNNIVGTIGFDLEGPWR